MTEIKPELEDNRFEAMYQRFKATRICKRKLLAVLFGLCFVAEILSLGFTFTWYHFREVNSLPFLDKFVVTRYLVSPLIFDNPARKPEGIDYIGTRERQRTEAQWFVSDAMFGWRPAPGVSILKQPNRIKDQVGWKMTNAQGFPAAGSYDYFYEKPKPAGTYRIIVLGGSNVEGDGAETPLDNLPSSVFFALQKAAGDILPAGYERLEVINAGVGAFTTSQEFLYLLRELTPFEPDLVISYGGAVDLIVGRINYDQSGAVEARFDYRKRAENSARLDRSYTFWGSLLLFGENAVNQVRFIIDEFAVSYVLSKGAEKFGELISSPEKLGASKAPQKVEDDAYIEAALTTYRRNVRLVASAAEIYGFQVAFVLEPIMPTSAKKRTPFEEEVYAGLSKRELEARTKYYEQARGLYKTLQTRYPDRSRVCFFDISRAFANIKERVYEDSSHVLGSGNRILAARIKDELGNCGMLGAAAARQ